MAHDQEGLQGKDLRHPFAPTVHPQGKHRHSRDARQPLPSARSPHRPHQTLAQGRDLRPRRRRLHDHSLAPPRPRRGRPDDDPQARPRRPHRLRAVAAARPGRRHDRRTAALPQFQAGQHPALARHHLGRGVGRRRRHRGSALRRHGLAAGAPVGDREEARQAAPQRRGAGALRRHQQLLRGEDLPAGPLRPRPRRQDRPADHRLRHA